MKNYHSCFLLSLFLICITGCTWDSDAPSEDLSTFLPTIAEPSEDPTYINQLVYAGVITDSNRNELIKGPASSGQIGDYFMRNSEVRFVIESELYNISTVASGGNLIDATIIDEYGNDIAEDHFGELSFFYRLVRTCVHDTVEVVRDGSTSGVAVVRASGKTAANKYINLRGIGLIPIPDVVNPDIDDDLECATTYTLYPDTNVLDVAWTYFNPSNDAIRTIAGLYNDTGGKIESFSVGTGFIGSLSFENILGALGASSDQQNYITYQGPNIAYGVVPQRENNEDISYVPFFVAGVSVLLFDINQILDILLSDQSGFVVPAQQGVNHYAQVIVGRDTTDVHATYRDQRAYAAGTIEGYVHYTEMDIEQMRSFDDVRVGLFQKTGLFNRNRQFVSFLNVHADGGFSGDVEPGDYVLVAEVEGIARSETIEITVGPDQRLSGLNLVLPKLLVIDYSVLDGDTNYLMPARITVLGKTLSDEPLPSLFSSEDHIEGIYRQRLAPYGGTAAGDERLYLRAGEKYRLIAIAGTEWSMDSIVIDADESADQSLIFKLYHVVPTPGVVAAEFHQHSLASPDSTILQTTRMKGFVTEGIEFIASTDHDVVTDFQPLIESLNLNDKLRAIPGSEVTTFAYGHFQIYPLTRIEDDRTGGAIDWTQNDMTGLGLLPSDIFDAAQDKGAEVIQINHPRNASGFIGFAQYFDRVNLKFDYDQYEIIVDKDIPVSLPVLRLPPDGSLWDSRFNAVEIWNGEGSSQLGDSNGDDILEYQKQDVVLHDWFNFISFGYDITPLGNSDSHTLTKNIAGYPRNYIRVSDDSAFALESGNVVDDVLTTMTGKNGMNRDIVVTNGPDISVKVGNESISSLGKTIQVFNDSAEVTITVRSPSWAKFDRIELFVNETPKVDGTVKPLIPFVCFTNLEEDEQGSCGDAFKAPQNFEMNTVEFTDNAFRYETTVSYSLSKEDVNAANSRREGAIGNDAWLVVRVMGRESIYPVVITGIDVDLDEIQTLIDTEMNDWGLLLKDKGEFPNAFTTPVYFDFDGDGYQAPFSSLIN